MRRSTQSIQSLLVWYWVLLLVLSTGAQAVLSENFEAVSVGMHPSGWTIDDGGNNDVPDCGTTWSARDASLVGASGSRVLMVGVETNQNGEDAAWTPAHTLGGDYGLLSLDLLKVDGENSAARAAVMVFVLQDIDNDGVPEPEGADATGLDYIDVVIPSSGEWSTTTTPLDDYDGTQWICLHMQIEGNLLFPHGARSWVLMDNVTVERIGLGLTAPSDYQAFAPGDTCTIEWTVDGVDKVDIDILTPTVAPYRIVLDTALDAATGSYEWVVPDTIGDECTIVLRDHDRRSFTRSATITIDASASHWIRLLSPNGGEGFLSTTTDTIRWTSEGVTTVDIREIHASQTRLVASGVDAGTGFLPWSPLLYSFSTENALIAISDADDATVADTSDAPFVIEPPMLRTSPSSVTLGHDSGSSAGVSIVSNTSWSIPGIPSWLRASTTADSGNGTLTFTAASDAPSVPRGTLVSIEPTGATPVSISVQQSATPIRWAFEPDTILLHDTVGSHALLTASATIGWQLTPDSSWLECLPASGDHDTTIQVVALSANPGLTPRSCRIIAAGSAAGLSDTVTVVQLPPLSIAILPHAAVLDSTMSDTVQVSVTSNGRWQVAADSSWLGMTPLEGSGNGTIAVYATDANTGIRRRSGRVVVTIDATSAADTLLVTQMSPYERVSAAPTTVHLDSVAPDSARITVYSDTSWQIDAGATWLSVGTSGGSGIVDIALNTVEDNTSDSIRTAAVVVTDARGGRDTVTVYQACGAVCAPPEILRDTTWGPGIVHLCESVTLRNDARLIIRAGTIVQAQGPYGIWGYGTIAAQGTQQDSIWFEPADTSTVHNTDAWRGISLDTTISATDTSIFAYCSFAYAQNGVLLDKANPTRITHCRFSRILTPSSGPVIDIGSGGLTIEDSDFNGCSARNAGAVLIGLPAKSHSACVLKRCRFRNNQSTLDGGALFVNGRSVIIDSCTFTSNRSGENGGAIYCSNEAYVRMTGTIFNQNYARRGGAITLNSGSLFEAESCVVLNDSSMYAAFTAFDSSRVVLSSVLIAGGTGGGIRCDSATGVFDRVIAEKNTLSGFALSQSDAYLLNCRSDSNQGVGLWISGGDCTAIGCMITRNSHINCAGVGVTAMARVQLTNCTIAANDETDSPIDYGVDVLDSSSVSADNCVVWQGDYAIRSRYDRPTVTYSTVSALGVYTGEGNTSEPPLFVDSVGGDFRLTNSSPCIDGGNPDTTGLGLAALDLVGSPRIVGGRVDRGAFEHWISGAVVAPIADVAVSEDAPDVLNHADMYAVFGTLMDSALAEPAVVSVSDSSLVTPWFNSDAGLNLHFGRDRYGTATVVVGVRNRSGGAVTDTFNVVVAAVNDDPPHMDSIHIRWLESWAPYTFTRILNARADPDSGQRVTYAIIDDHGAGIFAIEESGTGLDFTEALDYETQHMYLLDIVATDDGVPPRSDTGTISIEVLDANDPPQLVTPIPDYHVGYRIPFTFTLPQPMFTDQDTGDSITLTFTKIDGYALPHPIAFDPETNVLSGEIVTTFWDTLPVLVVATDTAGATARDTFGLIVDQTSVLVPPDSSKQTILTERARLLPVPNPAQTGRRLGIQLYVRPAQDWQSARLTVHNINGEVVLKRTYATQPACDTYVSLGWLETEGLPSGVYLATLRARTIAAGTKVLYTRIGVEDQR